MPCAFKGINIAKFNVIRDISVAIYYAYLKRVDMTSRLLLIVWAHNVAVTQGALITVVHVS